MPNRPHSTDEPEQPVPQVGAADVERVIVRDYPAGDVVSARRLVGEIDLGGADASARVQLAALKLADGDIGRLRHWAREATMDYRDVIAPAEYPRCCRDGTPLWEMPAERRRAIFDEDWRQYEAWLRRR